MSVELKIRPNKIDEPSVDVTKKDSPHPELQIETPIAPEDPNTRVPEILTGTPEELSEVIQKIGVQPFRDQYERKMLQIPAFSPHAHQECHQLGSESSIALADELLQKKAAVIKKYKYTDLRKATDSLKLQAIRGSKHELFVRNGFAGKSIFIDLGDEGWNAVKVNKDGWNIEQPSEPLFVRSAHMKAMVKPSANGTAMAIFKHIPVSSDHEKILLISWLLSAMHPGLNSPILIFAGPQGSAKTTRSLRLRSLIDPSEVPLLADSDIGHLHQIFQHHSVPVFENVSSFNRKKADAFCRAVTGAGTEKRKLYTDSESILYSYRRTIIINGLEVPSTRADFLDRCLVIHCERIKDFQSLNTLDESFQAAAPEILGGLLNLFVKTLKNLDISIGSSEFRMADFNKFGRAVAVAMGKQPGDFDTAYRMNNAQIYQDIADDNLLARLVCIHAGKYTKEEPWTGSLIELDGLLRITARDHGIHLTKFPNSTRWMSSQLSELGEALKEVGVHAERLKRRNRLRPWKIYSTSHKRIEQN